MNFHSFSQKKQKQKGNPGRIVDDGAVAGPSRVEVFHDDEEEVDEPPAPFSTELLKVTREGSTRNSGIIDQHRFRVRIDTRRIFNGTRDINEVLVAVIHSVIEQVRGVVTYREYTLRAGFLFTDRNGGCLLYTSPSPRDS